MSHQLKPARPSSAEFLDIDTIISAWAWQRFYETRESREDKRLRLEDVQITPNLADLLITHERAQFRNEHGQTRPTNSNLFSTSFSNRTDEEQSFSVNASRCTRSTCELTVGRTFTLGGSVSVKVGLPGGVSEVNAGFNTELALERTTRQTTENELSWGVDSSVRVPPRHRASARIEVVERELSADFSVRSRLEGRVRATISSLRDNGSHLMSCAADVPVVFGQFKRAPSQQAYFEEHALVLVTEGSMNFRFGVEQLVVVEQEPL